MIIYPPFIGDTIPAFTRDKVVIPFSQNPAVDIGSVSSFGLIVKNYLDSKTIAVLTATKNNLVYNSDTRSGEVTFIINKEEWEPISKQYYKFQMSYSDDDTYNAYSTASIGRCIDRSPILLVIGAEGVEMSTTALNFSTKKFIGKYSTSIISEPLYSYRFFVTDLENNTILQDTSMLLHNVDMDNVTTTTRTSTHEFVLRYDLEQNKQYLLTYEIVTINGYTSKKEYKIIKMGKMPMPFEGSLYINQNERAKDNGYIEIVLIGPACKGEFILERTIDKKEWTELTRFSLTELSDVGILDTNNKLTHVGNFVWKDWSIEQGVKYTYAISQYYQNEYSERKLSTTYMADFEHIFLSDGKRQLKIEYNPKVSSFKDTILEQKTDTIGNNYPFFFRNNQVRYKEIPISGLISYQMDKDNLFMDSEDLGLVDVSNTRESTNSLDNFKVTKATTDLVGYNYSAERKFKLSVLEWLTNGELKLFRSPAEGNYVVRLMNTSLSPNDALGRMLHTFSSTGYEAAAADINTLLDKKLIELPILQDPKPSKTIVTLKFSDIKDLNKKDYNVLMNKLEPPHITNTIENIQWISTKPNKEDYIILDGQKFYNTTGILKTPMGVTYNSVIIGKINSENEENYGSTLTFEYLPDLSENEGIDLFKKMINESTDIIFSAPIGTTLRGNNGILHIEGNEYENIYKTYVLIVRRDINYNEPDDFKLTFLDYNNPNEEPEVIDCSDGQIRYYYNLSSNIIYEKTPGLHLDIYARLGGTRESLSSRLGEFVLGTSKLGA